jgi:hypothetical protein
MARRSASLAVESRWRAAMSSSCQVVSLMSAGRVGAGCPLCPGSGSAERSTQYWPRCGQGGWW